MDTVPPTKLEVRVIEAKNLKIGKKHVNPFVLVFLDKEKVHKTSIVKKDQNPCWDSLLEIEVKNVNKKLKFEVWDKHLFHSEKIGVLSLYLQELAENKERNEWFSLTNSDYENENNPNPGQIHLSIFFHIDLSGIPSPIEVQKAFENMKSGLSTDERNRFDHLHLVDRWTFLCSKGFIPSQNDSWLFFIQRFEQNLMIETSFLQELFKKLHNSSKIHIKEFVKVNGLSWLFDSLGFHTYKIRSFHSNTKEDIEKISLILSCILITAKVKAFLRCLLKTVGAIPSLFLAVEYVDIDQMNDIIEWLLVASAESFHFGRETSRYLFYNTEIFHSLMEELNNGEDLSFKISFLTLINTLISVSPSIKTRVALRDQFISEGLDFAQLEMIKNNFPDSNVGLQVDRFVTATKDDAKDLFASETKSIVKEKTKQEARKLKDKLKKTRTLKKTLEKQLEDHKNREQKLSETIEKFKSDSVTTSEVNSPRVKSQPDNEGQTQETSTSKLDFTKADSSFDDILNLMMIVPSPKNSKSNHVQNQKVPPPPNPGMPPPPPPPPAIPPKNTIRKRQTLRFDSIPNDQKTIWAEINPKGVSVDAKKMEEIFLSTPNEPESKKSIVQKKLKEMKNQQPTILEPNRRSMIEIILTKYKIDVPALVDYLLNGKKKGFSVSGDLLGQLSLIFTDKHISIEDEKQKLMNDEMKDQWKDPEQFLFEMYQIPRIESKLEVLTFKEEIRSLIRDGIDNLQLVLKTLHLVREKPFKRFLEYVLAASRQLNKDTALEKLSGFRLSGLCQLSEVKSKKERDQTLLSFIVEEISKKEPDVLDFLASMNWIEASRAFFNTELLFPHLLSQLFLILQEISRCNTPAEKNFKNRMIKFFQKCKDKLKQLSEMQREVFEIVMFLGGNENIPVSSKRIQDSITAEWNKQKHRNESLKKKRMEEDIKLIAFFENMKIFQTNLKIAVKFHEAKLAQIQRQKKRSAYKVSIMAQKLQNGSLIASPLSMKNSNDDKEFSTPKIMRHHLNLLEQTKLIVPNMSQDSMSEIE